MNKIRQAKDVSVHSLKAFVEARRSASGQADACEDGFDFEFFRLEPKVLLANKSSLLT